MLVAVLPLRLFRESCQFIVGVVLHLIGVVGGQFFGFAESLRDAILHSSVTVAVIALLGAILRFNQQYGHTLESGVAVVVVR